MKRVGQKREREKSENSVREWSPWEVTYLWSMMGYFLFSNRKEEEGIGCSWRASIGLGFPWGTFCFFLWIVGLSSWYSTLVTYYNHLGELLNLLYAQANPTDSLLQNLCVGTPQASVFFKVPHMRPEGNTGSGGSLLEEMGVAVSGHRVTLWEHSVCHLAGLPGNWRCFKRQVTVHFPWRLSAWLCGYFQQRYLPGFRFDDSRW